MTADAHTDSSRAAAFDDDVLRYWAPVLARMPRPGPYLVVDMRPPGPRAMSATSILRGSARLRAKARRW